MRYLVLLLALLAPAPQYAQYVLGISDVWMDCSGCPVESWSVTELDYEASFWYDARADGFLSKSGTIQRQATERYGNPWVEFTLSTPLVYNSTFQI